MQFSTVQYYTMHCNTKQNAQKYNTDTISYKYNTKKMQDKQNA